MYATATCKMYDDDDGAVVSWFGVKREHLDEKFYALSAVLESFCFTSCCAQNQYNFPMFKQRANQPVSVRFSPISEKGSLQASVVVAASVCRVDWVKFTEHRLRPTTTTTMKSRICSDVMETKVRLAPGKVQMPLSNGELNYFRPLLNRRTTIPFHVGTKCVREKIG